MSRITCLIILCLASLTVSAAGKNLLILGDSISAAYGISREQGWVHLLEEKLRDEQYQYTVINASISGETTLGAKVRLNELLNEYQPQITIIELGGNDGLRGIPIKATRENFTAIIDQLRKHDSGILLVPMTLPPNYGPVYIKQFEQVYRDLGQQDDVYSSRFILEGIGDKSELMQADGIHPVASAQPKMLENIWPGLLPLLHK